MPKVWLFTIKFNGYRIWEVKNSSFPTNQPIPVKQGQVRGNKNSIRVGLCKVDIEIVQISLFIIERSNEK